MIGLEVLSQIENIESKIDNSKNLVNQIFEIDSTFKQKVDQNNKQLQMFLNEILSTLKDNDDKHIFQNEEVRKINLAIEKIRDSMRLKFLKKDQSKVIK